MSINQLSAAAVEHAAPQVAKFARPVEVEKPEQDIPVHQQVIKDDAQVLKVNADKQSDGALNQQKSAQEQQNITALNAEEEVKKSETLTNSLQQAVESTKQTSSLQIRKLEFSPSQESGQAVVKVIDKKSNEVIRQIPSEEFIRVAEKLTDLSDETGSAQGLLFESKV